MLMEQRLEHMCERVWSNTVSNNNNPNSFLTCLGIYRFSPHLLVHTCRHLLKILREGSSGKQRCGSGNTPHKWCQHTVDFETWPNMTKSLAVPLTYWRASALFCTTEGLRTEKLVKQKKKKRKRNLTHNTVPEEKFRGLPSMCENSRIIPCWSSFFSSYTKTFL